MVLSSAAVMCLSAGLSAAPAAAHAPSPSIQAQAATAGTTVCTPTSKDVTDISGLVATQSGYYAIQDSQAGSGKPRIFVLDNSCKLTNTIAYPTQARDPEDAAIDKNGTLYIADIGDNDVNSGGSAEARSSVAIWTMAAGAKQPTINRVVFPDGKKHDAEALLINGDGLPVIITKTSPSEVWVPEGPLVPNVDKNLVKLRKVGTFTAQETKTANPLGLLGWKLVTGAASSPDGSKVVVRTYSDAYEFDVSGGDVVKAITTGKPRITPLPQEPQGESITYTPDGKYYITISDVDGTKKAPLLKYTPTDISAATAGGGGKAAPKTTDKSFLQSLTLQDITYTVAAIGVLGLILVIAGVIGIRRSRAARRAAGPPNMGSGRAEPPADDFNIPATVGGSQHYDDDPFGPPPGNVYGAGRQPSPPDRQPNVYGSGPGSPGTYGSGGPGGAPGGGAGNVYGGGPSGPGGGNVYGGGGSGGGGAGGAGGGGNVYGGGGGGSPDRGGYGQRGGYGPSDYDGYDGYDRGYAPHR
ncbi:hypothetical protein GCM10022255_019470 [Dactylosporangium darangshiense]|uniref:Uncharacterized protein n=1 Tax=Dactylosporangium darangshiense TaxID=579108 RepID=A0ABP8D3P3_9ACTN